MMPKIKVYGGTPMLGEKSRCLTCRNAQIIKGMGQDDTVYCGTLGHFGAVSVRQPVAECSAYDDKRQPALYQLERIAWRIDSDKNGRVTGFMSPKEWKKLPGNDD